MVQPTADGRNPKQPAEMYETRRKIMVDIYHINWWTPDFWTINRTQHHQKCPGRHHHFPKAHFENLKEDLYYYNPYLQEFAGSLNK